MNQFFPDVESFLRLFAQKRPRAIRHGWADWEIGDTAGGETCAASMKIGIETVTVAAIGVAPVEIKLG
jgi:hypothetical protein